MLICRKTLNHCLTAGMCAPHGGCHPGKGFEAEHLDLGKFIDWVWSLRAERDQLKTENEVLRNALAPLLSHWDDLKAGESINVDAARAAMSKEG